MNMQQPVLPAMFRFLEMLLSKQTHFIVFQKYILFLNSHCHFPLFWRMPIEVSSLKKLTMNQQPIIRIENLRKSYKNGTEVNEVLKGINLEVMPGQIIGYIGPNGAGKSTTLKIICGLLDSFKGNVEVAGYDIRKNPVEIKQRIGYIPELANLYESITPNEYFMFISQMRGLDTKQAIEKAKKLMALFEIETSINQRMGSFSKGMKQKILIISTLLHNPDILFMDEPLSGLDANSVITVKEIITQMAAEGKTIFYSSHLMDIVEKVSDRIILLYQGNVVADGTFEEIKGAGSDESLEKIFARLTGNDVDHSAEIFDALNN
jgi:ABC-2 type transport system ATP-binding protein